MPSPTIVNDLSASRFVMRLGGDDAELTYRIAGSQIFLDYVGVPDAWRNRGFAGKLTRTALEYARENGLNVVPVCPYVRWYLAQHPEYHDLVKG